MEVLLNERRITLAERDALGDGGEAVVIRHERLAVKIYRQPTPERAAKLETLLGLAATLPPEVVAPVALVRAARTGEVVGFAMRALDPDHEVVASLSRRGHRSAAGVSAGDVARLFVSAHRTLAQLHAAGAVVGDLNDTNEMYARRGTALSLAWIDADSFQFGGHPCTVATETFLDPDLYGPDRGAPVLLPDGVVRRFSPESDWYAFAVLAFRSLTLVHPYGGVDPKLATLPQRARARRSVFASGVRYPRAVGYALEILSDALASAMSDVFDRGARGIFPRHLLEEYAGDLVRCRTCGVEHPSGRARCPGCAALAPPTTTASAAGCRATDLIEARGPIVALSTTATTLRCLAVEEGRLILYTHAGRRPERHELCALAPPFTAALGAGIVALATRGDPAELTVWPLVGEAPGAPIASTTERFGGAAPAVACTPTSVLRTARGMVMRGTFAHGEYEEQPAAAGMVGQTRIFAGARRGELALIATRVFGDRQLFLLAGSRRADIPLAALPSGDALLDEAALFAEREAAYLRLVRSSGRDWVHTLVVDDGAALLASYAEPVSARAAGSTIHGGALAGRSLLFATDRGLARERFGAADDPCPADRRIFAATEPFVTRGSLVRPWGDGVAVAHGHTLRVLTPS